MQHKPIKRVLIVGGTHGNESTGVYLVKKWQQFPHLLKREGLEVETLLANPEAIEANKRYLDKDLNRCFSHKVLSDETLSGHELSLAHQLVDKIGGKGKCNYDMIIDLHTSTANMQVNLVLTKHDRFHHQMMAYMTDKRGDVVVTSEAEMIPDHHFLCSLADRNVIIEVGPVPQGLLDFDTIEKTEKATQHLLDFIESYNANSINNLPREFELFEYTGKECFPTNEQGEIIGVLHPNLKHADFSLLKTGDPLFIMQDGSVITHRGEPTYISFVNEAAYYDQAFAFCRLRKTQIVIEDDD